MPARYVLTIMMFLGFVNVYALRINLSMAIVAMVNNNNKNNTHLVSVNRGIITLCNYKNCYF